MRSVGFIGAGRAGAAFAVHCHRLGYSIAGVVDRRPGQARAVCRLVGQRYRRLMSAELASTCDVLFITTPDFAIRHVYESVRHWLPPGAIVVHCSGAVGVDVFGVEFGSGLDALAIHPAQSLPTRAEGIDRLPGSFFAIEGTRRGLRFGRELVRGLRGECLVIRSGDRPLYHAMCVFASNFVSALLASGETLAVELGMTRRQARRVLGPLAVGAAAASARSGASKALTGPVLRGDAATVESHLVALRRSAPELVPLYEAFTRNLIPIAVRQGLGREAAARLWGVLAT